MAEAAPRWEEAVAALRARLRAAFAALDRALEGDPAALGRRPREDAWSPLEVAEHVGLVDRFLLLLAAKIADRGLARAARGLAPPERPSSLAALERIAARDFRWPAPEHMLPRGGATAAELRARLAGDLARCEALLDRAPRGEGALHAITMSVVGGRLDLYQFLAVIALHAERHARQAGGC